MEDKKIVCRDCGKTFVFTVRDQEFYKEKGFTNELQVRCKDCRNARKHLDQAEVKNRQRYDITASFLSKLFHSLILIICLFSINLKYF